MNKLQVTSSGTIPGYSCVKLVGVDLVATTSSNTDVVFGVTDYSQKNNGEIVVLQDNENETFLLRAGTTIAAGDILVPSTNGVVVKSSDGGGQFIATESAVSGQNLWARITSSKSSSSQITYKDPSVNSVEVTIDSKISSSVDVRDFGALGDGTNDDTAAFVAAMAAASSGRYSVYVPSPNQGASSFYKITDEISIPNNVSVFGTGYGSYVKQVTLKKNLFKCGNNTSVRNLRLEMPANVSVGEDLANQNAVYANGKTNVEVSGNVIKLSQTECGVQMNACRNVKISDNIIYGALWDENPVSSSYCDILVLGSDAGNSLGLNRTIVSRNFCLSNNSLGIWVDAYGGNADIVIDSNVSVALDPATCTTGGTWSEASNGGVRRHAISVGYQNQTVDGPRALVTNNVCRNTRLTGIYMQAGNSESAGPILCANNIVSKVGQNTAASSGLAGGIWTNNCSPNTLVTGNLVYKQMHPGEGGITFIATLTSGGEGPTFSNNTIIESAGYGFLLSSRASRCTIRGNIVSKSAKEDIRYEASSSLPELGGIVIESNSFKRNNFNSPSIFIDPQNGVRMNYIRNNYFRGYDKDSGNSENSAVKELNTAIRLLNPIVSCVSENSIENFHVGVAFASYFTDNTRFFSVDYSRNYIKDCNVGFGISQLSSNKNSTVPICDNTFNAVTSSTSFALGDGSPGGYKCGYISRKDGNRIVVLELNAAPTTDGNWQIGDRVEYTTPTAGGHIGAVCTAAGTPGTWKTFGSITP